MSDYEHDPYYILQKEKYKKSLRALAEQNRMTSYSIIDHAAESYAYQRWNNKKTTEILQDYMIENRRLERELEKLKGEING